MRYHRTTIRRRPLVSGFFYARTSPAVRMNTDIVARLLCAAFTLYPPFAALTMPDSVSGLMRLLQGGSSFLLFAGMATISGLIFVDVGVNSLWPGGQLLPWLARRRDSLYLGAAFCALVVPFSVSRVVAIDSGASYLYVVIFLGSLALAWCDAYAKRNTTSKKAARAKTPL